jgi:hypothetical protein
MNIQPDKDLMFIFENILSMEKTLEEWREIEAPDYFQRGSYEGGYDATEDAFCFSYYDENGKEFWFQLSLDDIKNIIGGKNYHIRVRPAD